MLGWVEGRPSAASGDGGLDRATYPTKVKVPEAEMSGWTGAA